MNSVNFKKNQLQRRKLRELRNKKTKKKIVAFSIIASLGLSVAFLWNLNLENASADSAKLLRDTSVVENVVGKMSDKIVGYKKLLADEVIYSSVGENPKILAHIKRGDYVSYYGEENSFTKVYHNGVEGYINSDNLENTNSDQLKVVDGYLLITKDYTVPEDFEIRFDVETENAMMVMFEAMSREGLEIGVSKKRYDDEILESSDDEEISIPNKQNSILRNGKSIELSFPEFQNGNFSETSQGKWLKENAHKYGFVLVYPSNKESVTGFVGNDRIYTFVGIKVANEIVKRDLTLQEYFLNR